ncbi:hypothetical protein GCM10025856_03970 [Methylophaga marina]|uniref:Prepilin-type N-terminal cleavage/methylation domain-containing protein n=1 Tax=Methylophaga marina TaxID=45495 RepID=A0ABN0TEN6_9GAMM|nr:type II secretion system protein [Methylophaga marina]BDZ72678.1 hypothetical protein GCM10025856_03970 [Methylophaga marina]
MNIKQMKSMISKFRSADVSMIKDADMRAKAQKLQNKQGGFTLLELLVVVAILAIIAGAVISSLDGQEELAAQKTTVHTMAAMEEAARVYAVTENRKYPGGVESLLCAPLTDGTDEFTLTAAAAMTALGAGTVFPVGAGANDASSANSNVPRTQGGLTGDLAGSLLAGALPDGVVEDMAEDGLTSVRYAHTDLCAGTLTFAQTTFSELDEDVDSGALVEVVKPSLIFRTPVVEGDEWEYGAGAGINLVSLDESADNSIPVAFYAEPAELTGNANDILVAFGVGPDSDLVGSVLGKAPSDGNVGPDKYGHFSLIYKIGECPAGEEVDEYVEGTGCAVADWDNEEIKLVGIIDAGGDGYDDEIAEARGNQEE